MTTKQPRHSNKGVMIFHPYDLLLLSNRSECDVNGSFFRGTISQNGVFLVQTRYAGKPRRIFRTFLPTTAEASCPNKLVQPLVVNTTRPNHHQRWRHADFPSSG